jgi:hypothetical protein
MQCNIKTPLSFKMSGSVDPVIESNIPENSNFQNPVACIIIHDYKILVSKNIQFINKQCLHYYAVHIRPNHKNKTKKITAATPTIMNTYLK